MGKVDYKKLKLAVFIYLGVALVFAGLATLFFTLDGENFDIMTFIWAFLSLCLLFAGFQEAMGMFKTRRIIKFGKMYNAKIISLVSKKMTLRRLIYAVTVKFDTETKKDITLTSRYSISPADAPYFAKDNDITIYYLEITNEFTY